MTKSDDGPILDANDPAYIPARPELGDVKINNELLSTVACYAALETPGVVWVTGKRSPAEILGKKEIDRGVSVVARDAKEASVQMEVNVEYGHEIYETIRAMQKAVKNAIESMTGFTVDKVDALVRGVVPRADPPSE